MTELQVYEGSGASAGGKTVPRPDPAKYRKFDWYYKNDSDLFHKLKHGRAVEQMSRREVNDLEFLRSVTKPLRNPIHRVVEFYATTMLMGTARQAFPMREVEDGVREAILKLWAYSNLDHLKQRIKRLVALHGLVFIKVCTPSGEPTVHFQEIKAEHCSDYSKDARGHIDYIRLDIPVDPPIENVGSPEYSRQKQTVTEVWRKAKAKPGQSPEPGYFRKWTRPRDATETSVVAEANLGPPEMEYALSEERGPKSLGFDFVPFVDIVAMDTSEKWPDPVYRHALPLIDEANKMATRYSELLFLYNKPHRAIEGIGNDPSGRPLPAPEVPGQQAPAIPDEDTVRFAGQVARLLDAAKPDETLGGDIWFGAPGNAKITDITPNVEFEAQRRALLDIAEEYKKELPELIYYETRQSAEISARALRILISSALDRTREMKANIENSLIKADKMGLTMAQIKGLDGFSEAEIGTYSPDRGFEHNFEEVDAVESSDIEQEELRGRRIANMIALIQIGWTREQAAQEVGLTHLKFPENAPAGAAMNPEDMSVGTGGNPGGGTNLENAAKRVAQGLAY